MIEESIDRRDIARQILRHRSFSFQEFSQRLAVYRVKETGFKQQVAIVLCDLLSELDPAGRHC